MNTPALTSALIMAGLGLILAIDGLAVLVGVVLFVLTGWVAALARGPRP